MVKTVCGDRRKSDMPRKQTSDIWADNLDVRSRKNGALKASPSPGTVGIIDGEREPLPE